MSGRDSKKVAKGFERLEKVTKSLEKIMLETETTPSASVSRTEMVQEILYDITADRVAPADSENQEGEAQPTLAELQSIAEVHLEPMEDPATWHDELVEMITVQDSSELEETCKAMILSILYGLEALISRYAVLWARCRVAAQRAQQPRKPMDVSPPPGDLDLETLFEQIPGFQAEMEKDDAATERLKLLLKRPVGDFEGTSQDGRVKVVCRRQDDLLDGLNLSMGVSNFHLTVVNIKPYQRWRLASTAYLQNVIEAINAATEDCRAMFGTEKTMAEIDAESDAERARIEVEYPKFWGPEGVGAIFCGLGASLFELNEIRNPNELDAFENPYRLAVQNPQRSPVLHFLETGRPAFEALQRRLETALETTAPTEEILCAVSAVRQFFLCSLGRPDGFFPDDLLDAAGKVYRAIEAEAWLERRRRETHLRAVTDRWRGGRRITALNEKNFEARSKKGQARVSGSGRLKSLEITGQRVSKRDLLHLLNNAFEQCTKAHRHAAASAMLMESNG